jgi:anion-transporting  ArsA/GET3 family ATPase
MQSLLDRKLLVVAGKGGVGKSTVAAALGLAGARAGRRTIVVEVGDENRAPHIFGVAPGPLGVTVKLDAGLWGMSIDPDRALLEWLQALGGRVSGRLLASSGTFQYFAAAAPGAKELVTMVKIWQLTREDRRGRRGDGYDLVVLDAPATGHALGLLSSPQTFGAIARVGPIAGQTRHVQELLQDPQSTAFVAVALGSEMAVTEALELQEGLERDLGRGLSAVIVNGLLPKRFSAAEMRRIEALSDRRDGQRSAEAPAMHAAVATARAVHERSRLQQNQLARLRRRSLEVIGVPFVWNGELKLAEVSAIAERLSHKL